MGNRTTARRLVRTCAAAAGTLALAATLAPAAQATSDADQPGSRSAYRLALTPGPASPEDIVAVPGTGQVVVSGLAADPLAEGSVGHLYSVDTRTRQVTELWPEGSAATDWDRRTYRDCPGPPDRTLASPHGVNVETDRKGRSTLYVVNHGGREAIEVFRVSRGKPVALAWVGCAVMPEATFPNGVAPLPHGDGIVVSNFLDPTSANPFENMFNGGKTGDLRVWTPREGWSTVPGSALAGANGVEVTPDGKTLVVAAWGERKLYRMPLGKQHGWTGVASVEVPMMPDNLRWTRRGTLLLTGQDITPAQFASCQADDLANCPTGMEVLEWDPRTMRVRSVFASDTTEFRVPTVASPVGRDIWVGSVKGDRIARLVRR